MQCRFRPIAIEEEIEFPANLMFAIAVSGVRARKTGEAMDPFNRLSILAERAATVWRSETGNDAAHLGQAMNQDASAVLSTLEAAGSPDLLRRAEHFAEESEALVPAGSAALRASDLSTFGEIVDRSQELAEQKLGNQIPETSYLALSARAVGAHAATAFGAGFGGAVWALVDAEDARQFANQWRERYLERFPRHSDAARFLLTTPGQGVSEFP